MCQMNMAVSTQLNKHHQQMHIKKQKIKRSSKNGHLTGSLLPSGDLG
ncbi:hypothetical protein M948_09615 [Virgibacillus sp. CM-4]|nr:hypothetical protein M948_09615 [Virgibacillus sp. CM-4]